MSTKIDGGVRGEGSSVPMPWLADIREKAGEHMDGFTFEDNFATRILARYLDLA